MIVVPKDKKVYVYTDPIDMRKSINGIIIILLENFDQNPQTGDFYLFVNRARNKIKCLFWSGNGFSLYYRRMEKGRFNYSKHLQEDKIIVSEQQMQALFLGLDFYFLTENSAENYSEFF